tara:strand:- start:451 stop:972 length:522 start_codon:yes stop_codon:yes gene_type:complete
LIEYINTLHPIILAVLAAAAVLFHPMQGARAILFFSFGYLSTILMFDLGWFATYGQHYYPLIIASALTIFLYHSLDITKALCIAWIIEVILISLNASMIWEIGLSPIRHWQATVILNAIALAVLVVNWWKYDNRIVYHRFFSLDQPLGIFGSEYSITDQEADGKESTKSEKNR